MGFLFDIFYFDRKIYYSDYVGSGMILVFTTMQSIFSNLDNSKASDEKRQLIQNELE